MGVQETYMDDFIQKFNCYSACPGTSLFLLDYYYLKNSVIMGYLKTAIFLIMDYFLLKRTGKLMTLLYNEI